MKSGKPKTKRYLFGGILNSQSSGVKNAPPPKRPAPAPAKPMPPLVNPASMKPLPTEVRTADANTIPLNKTVYRSPAVPSKPTGLGAMPATPTKTTGGPFNLPAGTVDIPQTGRAPSTKTSLSGMLDILSGRAPAPTTSSAPNKPSVGYADDMAEVYKRAPAISKGIAPATPPLQKFPDFSGWRPISIEEANPGPMMPGDYNTPGAPKVVRAGSKPYVAPPEFAKEFVMMEQQRAARAADPKLAMKKGGAVKAYAKGGKVSSASSRGDGIAQRGKTKGRMV